MSTTSHSSGAMSGSSSSGHANIQRVTKDSIDRQLTAKALIGKNVYDSQGEKLGEVEDVVLDGSGARQLATAFSSRQADGDRARATSDSIATTPATGLPGNTYPAAGAERSTTAGSTARSEARGAMTDLANAANDVGASMQTALGGGAAAIISSGGLFSRNELVRVPLSQLNYDAGNDRITLNVSRSEFSSLTEPSDTARGAAE